MPCATREKKDGETYVICYGSGYGGYSKKKAKAKPKTKPKLKAPKTTPSKIKTSVKPYGAGKTEFKKPKKAEPKGLKIRIAVRKIEEKERKFKEKSKPKAKPKTKPKAKPKTKPKLKAPKTTPSKIKTSVKSYGAGKTEFKKPVEFIIEKSKEKEFVGNSEKAKKYAKKYPSKKMEIEITRINKRHLENKWVEPMYNLLDKYKLLEPKNDRYDRVKMIDWKKAPIKLKDDLKELKNKYDTHGIRNVISLLRKPVNASVIIEREMEEVDLDELSTDSD